MMDALGDVAPRRTAWAVALFLLACAGLVPAQGQSYDTSLEADGVHPVFVEFEEQLLRGREGFAAFCRQEAEASRSALRKRVIAGLRALSSKSWAKVEGRVDELRDQGRVQDVVRTWIVGGFFCRADAAAVAALAKLDAVGFVYRQALLKQHEVTKRALPARQERRLKRALELERSPISAKELQALDIPWNLERIGAPSAWKRATGRGVTIAVIDTGLCDTPALTQALWRNADEVLDGEDSDKNGYVDDVFGWDFGRGHAGVLTDTRGHGSMCAGIAVGRPVGGRALGVAPGARVMVLRGSGVLRAYEYALANGADILSMSYMWIGRELGNYRAVYRRAHEHLCVGGVVAVGGAGNFAKRAEPGKQIALPKDIPCVLAVAGVVSTGVLAEPSSRGPVSWAGVRGYGEKIVEKPDLTACFGGFPVLFPATAKMRPRWTRVERTEGASLILGPRGNSFAGPHVAGAAAILLELRPEMPAWRVRDLLMKTAEDMGPEGHDPGFGAGMLRIDAAVRALSKN